VLYEILERLFSRQVTATPLSDYYTTPVLTEKIVFNNIEKKATGADEADVYQENIFKTVKRISLKDIFSDAATLDKKNNVAIVWGAPGVGKTILSRYCTLYFDDNAIVFLFEVGKLENLSLNKDLLKTLIDNFYADFGANFSSESLESWMNERKEKIIFILDGIDEGSSKQALLNKLITQISQRFRLIITSRALDFDDLVKTNLKSILSHENVREFEAIGFDDAGIDDFITKYFRQENQSERRHNFLAIIQKNKIIWNIAHNPMQLELICFLATLENTEQNFFQDNRLTLSKLYQKIEMKVLNRQISSDKHPEIKAHKNEIIIALSRLGYHMFFERDNEKQISGEKLEQAIKNSNQSEITISNFIRLLVNTGFIRETGKSNDISDMQYYFSHKSLQEYFAAKYISNNFETSSDVKRIIISHRYDYRYILVWRFVAGILYYEYNITKIDDYFSLLLSYPREVVGSRHLFLMAASIDEMMLDTNISVVNKLFEEQLKFLGLFLTKTNQESFWYQELARSQFILDSRAFSKKLYEVISSFDNQYHPNRDENVFFLLDHMKNVPQNIISKFYDKSLDSVKYQFLISLFKKKIISPETAVFLIDTYENLLINHNYLRIVEPLLESRLPLIDNELSKVVRSRINFSNLENLDFVKEILLIRHISLTIDEFEKIVNAVSTYQKEMPRQVLWYFRHRNMNTNEIQFLMNKIEGDESISYRVNIANLLPIIDKFNATQRTDIFKIINDSSPLDEAIKKPIVNNLIETNLFLDGAELDLLFWLLCKWSDCKNNDYLKRQVNAKIVAKALFDDLDNLQDLHALSQMASTSFKFNSIFDKVISFEKKDKSNDMVYHSLINLTKKSLSDSQISAIWDVILDNKVHNHYRRQLLETLVTNNDRPDFCERLYSAFVNNTGNFDFYNIVGNVIVNHLKLNDEQFEKMLEFFVSNIDSGNPILSFYASKLKQFSVAKINPEHLGFLANREIMWNIRNFRELRCHWFAEDPYIYLSKLSSMNFSFAFLPTCIDFFISSNYFFLYEEGVFYFPRDNLFMAVEIHRDYMSRISSWAWNNNSFSLFLNNYNLQRMDFPINPENIYSVANASKSKLVNKEIASNYGLPHQQTGTGLALALCEDNDCYQNTEDRVYPKTDFIGALVKYTKVPTSNPDYVPQFDMGRWEDSHNHDITSEPIYLYRVFRLGQEVGSATFYGEKCFCRSENGLRHNVISRSGVLTNFEIDPSSIQKICSSLPPSNIFEKMFYYSQFEPAICHGAIQGIAEVISKAFHRSGKLTQNTANNLRLGLSCFIPFIFNTLSRYQRSNQDGLAGLYEAAYDATFDIVDLFLLTALFQLGVFLLKTAVLMFNRNNNSVSSKVNCVSSSLGRYGIYACNAISIGVCPVIEGLVKVTAAEKVVTSAGDFLINRFISGSNSKSGPKVSFSD
ncbi:MAG: NACHT domain-containing NTPase, partial [Gammaproteobacteria bacterium]